MMSYEAWKLEKRKKEKWDPAHVVQLIEARTSKNNQKNKTKTLLKISSQCSRSLPNKGTNHILLAKIVMPYITGTLPEKVISYITLHIFSTL